MLKHYNTAITTTIITIVISLSLTLNAHSNTVIITNGSQIAAINSPIYKNIIVKDTPNTHGNEIDRFEFAIYSHPTDGTSGHFTKTVVQPTNGIAKTSFVVGSKAGTYHLVATKYYKNTSTPQHGRHSSFYVYAKAPLINDLIVTNGSGTSNVWKKFNGETTPQNTPSIVDFSYAGYERGEKEIPETNQTNKRIYNVTDYQIIPNDGISDGYRLQKLIERVRDNGGNAVIYFPPGKYDIHTDEDDSQSWRSITIQGHNIVIKGSGSQGYEKGGTTLFQHNSPRDYSLMFRLFGTQWRSNGDRQGITTNVVGEYESGVKSFLVQDASKLNQNRPTQSGRHFIAIQANKLKGEDFNKLSSRPITDMKNGWQGKKGIDVLEYYEVDRIESNRVYMKTPIHTHLNSKFKVYWYDLSVGYGFEDLHIDGNLQESYTHHGSEGHYGFGGIMFQYTAHSWIKRVRFSNNTNPFGFHNGLHNTATNIIVDGKKGHFPCQMINTTYCLVTFLEDRTDYGAWHGVGVQAPNTGNVYYAIAGDHLKGPDSHGSHPRNTLFDNVFTTAHDNSGGVASHNPRHLDGYIRWNNSVSENRGFNFWGSVFMTEVLLIGYKHNGTQPTNAYVESYNNSVYPNSLWIAQLQKRMGSTPYWITQLPDKHIEFYQQTYSGKDIGVNMKCQRQLGPKNQ